MQGCCRDSAAVGSSEYNNEILDDGNISLVDYGVTSSMVVVNGFVLSNNGTVSTFNKIHSFYNFIMNSQINILLGNPCTIFF